MCHEAAAASVIGISNKILRRHISGYGRLGSLALLRLVPVLIQFISFRVSRASDFFLSFKHLVALSNSNLKLFFIVEFVHDASSCKAKRFC